MAQKHGVAVSRISHGVPLGGELEFTDQSTIAHAFSSRLTIES
jgi:recombination protein RecR